ncbi:MAG: amino acid ABC transporter permease [Alphaproteobacteria bacterium]|nr:amino acid ABC transporter permease [Alphaproteobacteria bacterium]
MTFDTALLAKHLPELLSGFRLTVLLAIAILAISTPAALLLALARESAVPALSWLSAAYVNTFRALPVLVVLYFTFYGLPQFGISLSSVAAAMLGISIASTAYLSEDMRAGLRGIDPGQYQAARALGLPYWRTIRRVILPQAIRIMIAPYITRAIIIVKATSIAGLVAVSELTGQAYGLISITYRAIEFLAVAAILYLALNAVLALLQSYAERRFARAGG